MDTTYSRKEIRKEIFALILPIIMENVFQVSASLVTVAMIGRLSPLDISAQGIVMRITETLNSLFRGGCHWLHRLYCQGVWCKKHGPVL